MRYFPEIDALRAIAVLLVIAGHLGFSSVQGGFIGVDVFFVISGCVITSILLEDFKNGTFSYFSFMLRQIDCSYI